MKQLIKMDNENRLEIIICDVCGEQFYGGVLDHICPHCEHQIDKDLKENEQTR